MKLIRIYLGLLTLAIGVSAHALGVKVIGNGGDPVALDFIQNAEFALDDLKTQGVFYKDVFGGSQISLSNLRDILETSSVLVSNVPVYSEKDGVTQISAAVNSTKPNRITVYGPYWAGIRETTVKKALALHEVLSLAGVESTGDYSYSRRYLAHFGITCSSGLCEAVPRFKCTLIKNMRSMPEYLKTVQMGMSGSADEILNMDVGSIRGTVVMNSGERQGLIMLLIYKDGETVSTMELRGAAYPRTLMTEWKDQTKNETWSIYCQ